MILKAYHAWGEEVTEDEESSHKHVYHLEASPLNNRIDLHQQLLRPIRLSGGGGGSTQRRECGDFDYHCEWNSEKYSWVEPKFSYEIGCTGTSFELAQLTGNEQWDDGYNIFSVVTPLAEIMFFWNVFRGKILLLSCMVFHSLALDANDKLCTNKQLILLPKEIYKNCNVFVSQRDALDAPTVKVPANVTLPAHKYMLLMVDPDEYPHSDMVYSHWIKTHITANANLKEERYIMVILGPDEWKEANISSPHWLRTHISDTPDIAKTPESVELVRSRRCFSTPVVPKETKVHLVTLSSRKSIESVYAAIWSRVS
ncbi:Hypothetical predicted protein [Octopus vulgaris]|uniref:Uncharacterized protein n=1 Tax=Octopus vulgaris TaxID=6645 RepID=A0AA36BA98_OCTVU|nr:Hypothetical predicted protein [Octopus vulgaris]